MIMYIVLNLYKVLTFGLYFWRERIRPQELYEDLTCTLLLLITNTKVMITELASNYFLLRR
jgi:hypothetical protein